MLNFKLWPKQMRIILVALTFIVVAATVLSVASLAKDPPAILETNKIIKREFILINTGNGVKAGDISLCEQVPVANCIYDIALISFLGTLLFCYTLYIACEEKAYKLHREEYLSVEYTE